MLIEDYKNWLIARQYSVNTVALYARRIACFLRQYKEPVEAGREDIQDYLISLHKAGAGYATINNHFSAIKNLYGYLSVSGRHTIQLDQNPLKYLMPLRHRKTVPRIIPDDDLNALFRQIEDLKTLRRCRDYAIMLFLLHGLRAEEICSLNLDDVYIDGRGVTRKMVIRVTGKGDKERIIVVEKSGDTEWAWERNDNFADVIRSGKGKLNVIDFLELYEDFWIVGKRIDEIYRKLDGALAIIAIQKNPNCDFGLGGRRSIEKARLAISMENNSLKILKAKNWRTPENPNGKMIKFRLVDGCKFSAVGNWISYE